MPVAELGSEAVESVSLGEVLPVVELGLEVVGLGLEVVESVSLAAVWALVPGQRLLEAPLERRVVLSRRA